MVSIRALALASSLSVLSASALAQNQPPQTSAPMSAIQIALACAPPPVLLEPKSRALRVAGAQDSVPRSLFDEHDLLVVNGGTANGVSLGQQYFLRRPVDVARYLGPPRRRAVRTSGWIRIVAVNERTAVGAIEHACGAIHEGDYLEPFAVPAVLAEAPGGANPSDLDFRNAGRVLFGDNEREIASAGEFLIVDRGTGQGLSSGTRFALFRDVRGFATYSDLMMEAPRLPLAAVGEGVVVSAGPNLSVVRVVASRDAVQAGDLVVPRRR